MVNVYRSHSCIIQAFEDKIQLAITNPKSDVLQRKEGHAASRSDVSGGGRSPFLTCDVKSSSSPRILVCVFLVSFNSVQALGN